VNFETSHQLVSSTIGHDCNWVQSQSNKPKKASNRKEKNIENLLNIHVLPFKTMAIMKNYFYFIHLNVKEFKPKIHLMKF